MAYWHVKAPLLVTGQTTDYTPAGRTCLDDGGEQKGLAPRYTVLTTGAFSGTTNVTVNAKTDVKSNNCVIDNNTNLMWTRYESDSVGPANNGTVYWDDTAGSDEDVFNYCDQANSAGLAGFSDWRVPNIFEIYTLSQLEAPSSVPDPIAFPGMTAGSIHSSTTKVNNTTQAVATSFGAGTCFGGTKTTITPRVLLVRGGR